MYQQQIQLCLDPKCVQISKIMKDAQQRLSHINCGVEKSLKDINLELNEGENQKIIMDFLGRNDSEHQDSFKKQIELARQQILQIFQSKLDESIQKITSQLSKHYVEIQRMKDVYDSIRLYNIDVLEKISGDFSFLLDNKGLKQLSQQWEQYAIQQGNDMLKLIMKTSQTFEEKRQQKIKPQEGQKIGPYHNHPLTFDIWDKENYKFESVWRCDGCIQSIRHLHNEKRWRCKECDFNCCDCCFVDGQVQNNGQGISPLHEHPLNYEISEEYIYPDGWMCDECLISDHPYEETRWICKYCDYDCCTICIDKV